MLRLLSIAILVSGSASAVLALENISVGDLKAGAAEIRALVADDFPHMQIALVNCLQSVPGVTVVATALNGQEALDKAGKEKLELAIIDLQMPVMDGFKLMRELRRAYPTIKLVAVSGHHSAAVTSEAIAAGADVFVSKNELPFGLVSAVEKLLAA